MGWLKWAILISATAWITASAVLWAFVQYVFGPHNRGGYNLLPFIVLDDIVRLFGLLTIVLLVALAVRASLRAWKRRKSSPLPRLPN
jgi:NADH:ubiquinone oxidoreductase subunit 4 (subunit M)